MTDVMKDIVIKQGYVPATCTLPGKLVLMLANTQGDACKGCNEDRAICNGRPKEWGRR